MTSRVALVTCQTLPEPDPDERPLVAALEAAGLDVTLLAWDAPDASPADFDLCVLRSCWNYPLDPQGFAEWVERAAPRTRLLNSAHVIRWNVHKRYLLTLAEHGLPTVPTVFADRGSQVSTLEAAADLGGGALVIKPAVSAGSYRTRRFDVGEVDAADAFLAELTRERDAMLQPYLRSVDEVGERALVWIDGVWTHAVTKRSRFQGQEEGVSEATELSVGERQLADRTLQVLGDLGLGDLASDLLYARLDLIAGADGEALISEVELVEPSLFLEQHPAARDRFVAALVRRLASG